MSSQNVHLEQWFPPSSTPANRVSVYRTEQAIALYPGCEYRQMERLICTHSSYEDAYAFAQLLAAQSYLPLQDFCQQGCTVTASAC